MKFLDHYGISERLGVSFSSFEDPRDGKKYKTVKVGGIEWFRENLNFDDTSEFEYAGMMQDVFGAEMPSVKSTEVCGRFYQFQAAQEACPEGWEIPNRSVFIDLFKEITQKNPNEWKDQERRIIYQVCYGAFSLLEFSSCGFYGYPSFIPTGKKKEKSFQGNKAYIFTSTKGSMPNGGSIFIFDPAKKAYMEDVGYDYYAVRPIRKNI